MRFSTKFIAIILFFAFNLCGQIPVLFEHPRDGKFKIVENDRFNGSTMIHGMGSFMFTVFTSAMYKKFNITDEPAAWAVTTVFGLGFLKEVEDGFREGFSTFDFLANMIGCATGGTLFAVLNYYHSRKVKIKTFNSRVYLTVVL